MENQESRNFGVVGQQLSHSFSPGYFQEKFVREHILNATYQKFELAQASQIKELFQKDPHLIGVNVTIPYKESVMPLLDNISEEALTIGAVNTIKKEGDELVGYNTDAFGFANSIKPFLASHHERALIFGNGGAAKAVKHVLNQLGITFLSVVRQLTENTDNQVTYTALTQEGIRQFPLLINTTPVGTYPNDNEVLPIPLEGIGNMHLCYDLIYNPPKTQFLAQAELRGAKTINGLSMLKLQAEKSWEIWNKTH